MYAMTVSVGAVIFRDAEQHTFHPSLNGQADAAPVSTLLPTSFEVRRKSV